MASDLILPTRRRFLRGVSFGAAMFLVPGAFAAELTKTPRMTEGPFYPDKLPLDTDNDLLIINDHTSPALGTITHLTGTVKTVAGTPLRGAVVEIWQCDNQGAYLHSGTDNRARSDRNFQGFGRFTTNTKGDYYFRTIKPVPYPGRTPHIHVIVKQGDKRLLTSQLFIKGFAQNERDGLYRGLDAAARGLLSIDFTAMPDSKIGELAAHFDIVVGLTPEDPREEGFRGPPRKPPRRGPR